MSLQGLGLYAARDLEKHTMVIEYIGDLIRNEVANRREKMYDVQVSSDRSFMVDPLSYFSFQPVLHDWCNKGCGMCYLVCGMVHIKEPLLLIGKSIPCCGSRFLLSLSEWSFTICLTPYNRKIKCVECVVK